MYISEESRDILQEVINTGIGRAAATFSEILDREIMLEFPKLLVLNSDQLIEYMASVKQIEYVNVRQTFHGGLEGQGIVSFPLEDGQTLVNRLLGNTDTSEPEFGVLERETILEVGNVLINAITCTISDMIEIETEYRLPELYIANKYLEVPKKSDEQIFCLGEGKFYVEGIRIEGVLVFVLSYRKIEEILNKLIAE